MDQPPTSTWCPHDHTQSWASVWFSGAPVTVTVTTTNPTGWGPVGSVIVRPQAAAVSVTHINATAIQFTLQPSDLGWKLSVESPWQLAAASPRQPTIVKHSLMLFADPSNSGIDPGVGDGTLRFDAGFHNLGGQMPLGSNVTTVYVAGGAWLSGGFITAAGSTTLDIVGRGVISGTATRFLKGPSGTTCAYNGSFCWSLVNLDIGEGHKLSGVVLHDPPKFVASSIAHHSATSCFDSPYSILLFHLFSLSIHPPRDRL